MSAPEAFIKAYLECAIWSSPQSDPDGNCLPSLDDQISKGAELDIAPETTKAIREDCESFWDNHGALVEEADMTPGQAGHDFCLTRNRHGTGFWDRGLPGSLGRVLTDAAHAYGSFWLEGYNGVISHHG